MVGGYNNIKAYKNAFANVDKVNQVIMLFDTAVASMQQAKQAIIDKNIQERYNKIAKVFQILTGLRDSLDHANGGEVAAVLSDWYSSTSLRVLSVNRSQDLNMCDMCTAHLKRMRDAWVEIEKQVKQVPNSSEGAEEASSASSSGSDDFSGNIQVANLNNSTDDFFTSAIKKAAYGASGSSGGMSISV